MLKAVFSIGRENRPLPGCTISGELLWNAVVFSLAKGTDISPETYPVHKLWLTAEGRMTALSDKQVPPCAGACFVTPSGIPVGVRGDEDSVYTEIVVRKESRMNPILKPGEVFDLKDLVPYRDGKIVNMDLINGPKQKFVVMAFASAAAFAPPLVPKCSS